MTIPAQFGEVPGEPFGRLPEVDESTYAADAELLGPDLATRVMQAHPDAFCWQQPPDRFLACDRVKHHLGRHSWETPDAAA